MANQVKKCVLHGVVNNETTDLYPRTNLASVVDMTAFARTLNGAVDAATARNTLGIQTSTDIINIIYPVGSVITLTNNTDPNEIYSGTTWVKMDAGRVLISAGTYTENGTTYTYNLGDKGGEAKHQITIEELVAHSHAVSISYADLQGSLTNANNDSITTCTNAGISGIISKTTGWGHYGGPASGDGITTGININASHGHNASVSNSGGSGAHENRPPYIVINRWKRTA